MHARKLLVLISSTLLALGTCVRAQALDSLPSPLHDLSADRIQRGEISWYGRDFAGRRTASGERFDPGALTMAHRTLPLGTIVEVTNNANGRHVQVRVNDRGPYHGNRVADLSHAASQRLDFVKQGVTDATIRVLSLPADKIAGAATGRASAEPSG